MGRYTENRAQAKLLQSPNYIYQGQHYFFIDLLPSSMLSNSSMPYTIEYRRSNHVIVPPDHNIPGTTLTDMD